MDKYTFEMIPGLIGEIAELLRSIDTKLDKLTAEPEPASAFPEWLNIKDLTAFMPTHPAAQSEFLAILILAMKSIGESRMTDQYRTVINGLLQKNLPIATYEQDLKVAPIWARKTIWNIAKKIGQWQNG